mmetsp:Transcript_83708/g.194707  ORF Transcript_83708/g.194707 Transcript_83708/m.194707 type:complete len:353 (-) Transcript_83708:1362-2420(-)
MNAWARIACCWLSAKACTALSAASAASLASLAASLACKDVALASLAAAMSVSKRCSNLVKTRCVSALSSFASCAEALAAAAASAASTSSRANRWSTFAARVSTMADGSFMESSLQLTCSRKRNTVSISLLDLTSMLVVALSIVLSRFSRRITARSVTVALCFSKPSKKSMCLIVEVTSPSCPTCDEHKRSNICTSSPFCRPHASESSSHFCSSCTSLWNSDLSSTPSGFVSASPNISSNFILDRSFNVSSSSCSHSFRCSSVAEIMFSLTTAVRIDRIAHDETTMKVTTKTFVTGITSKRGSTLDRSPFITLKKTYMASGTLGKIAATLMGGWSPPKTMPCPISNTPRMAQM